MHTVFSTECNSYFDWQSVALFYSHNQVEQPGYITRLMACDHPGHYPGLDIGPTYIHPNYGNPKNNLVQDHYTPYNKPGSLYHWLFENAQVPEADHVLVVEPDMIFRKPIDCEKELAVRPGVVASAPYSYLSGTDNGMAAQFVGAEALNRLDKVGGFYCFKMDDLRKVVPALLIPGGASALARASSADRSAPRSSPRSLVRVQVRASVRARDRVRFGVRVGIRVRVRVRVRVRE